MGEYICSKSNDKIKTVRKLADKKYRAQYGLFVIEGHKLVYEYLRCGGSPVQIFVTEQALDKYTDLVKGAAGAQVFTVPEDLYLHISTEQAPQGILALCPLPKQGGAIKEGNGIILESVRDTGNLGTVIRTAAALGIDNILLSSDCADLYNPKTLRATMGMVFCTNICISDDICKSVRDLRADCKRVFAAMPSGNAVDVRDLGLKTDDFVVVGNEGNGITAALAEACDGCVTIPMVPGVESLNASVAASVLMWELARGRIV